ncbi:hypothetical protein WL77_14050 [Burkholderia ubonensis]|uniref:hypothetical protein n=1 Tax=Burkholderia ubonensis TaxID=101571 RepID=UPI0007598A23|nr:hypothetical protein [Burkholderia ubonensis]KWE68559.1 hypothetical protein WL77_14050 [Burkholderia ubonensis]KWE81697.1 hypothetical protein WL79_31325 [Burkholderia ubonensis]
MALSLRRWLTPSFIDLSIARRSADGLVDALLVDRAHDGRHGRDPLQLRLDHRRRQFLLGPRADSRQPAA